MKIEVLGTGCPKCKLLESLVKETVDEMGLKAEIIKITEIDKIIEYGVMMTPALVINGSIVCSGKIPSKEEIKGWLK
jgi:small redox-active disulfide protein 2